MEEDSPSKPSVAELAGRFKGHAIPAPTNENRVRKLPGSLKLCSHKDNNEEESQEAAIVTPNPFKVKMKNSSIIEKLQANLALSPSTLLPSPKSPEVKLQQAGPLSPPAQHAPLSIPSPGSQQSSEEEDAVGFQHPPEGTPLPSINKTRARLSFKRRPPTRRHRLSGGEEAGAPANSLSPWQPEPSSPRENGEEDQGSASQSERRPENSACGPATPNQSEDGDEGCAKTADKVCENADAPKTDLASQEELGGSGALGDELQHPVSTGISDRGEQQGEITQGALLDKEATMV